MNHNVRNVEELYLSSKSLYDDGIMNGDNSADGILKNLNDGINNLKINWKGVDAGVKIQEVVTVYNAMVIVRNSLLDLVYKASSIASNYRKIQNANGGRLTELQILTADAQSIADDYFDNADTIDINPDAAIGRNFIDQARNSLDTFETNVRSKYEDIMGNWRAGTGRAETQNAFEHYMSDIKKYKEKLLSVSQSISTALGNYDF